MLSPMSTEKKDHLIHVAVTKREHDRVNDAAKKYAPSRSALIRQSVFEYLKKLETSKESDERL